MSGSLEGSVVREGMYPSATAVKMPRGRMGSAMWTEREGEGVKQKFSTREGGREDGIQSEPESQASKL